MTVQRLLSVAGPALGPAPAGRPDVPGQLADLLASRNGFYAFESALHVLPSEPVTGGTMSVQAWNQPDLWRSGYGSMTDGLYFFAEDAFGSQFALSDLGVVTFDPETGEIDELAPTLDGWADEVLEDYEVLTGFPLAHAWQERNGPLPANTRLLPKRPFVLGGEFEVENLYLLDAVTGMHVRGELAVQIRDLPEGTSVRFKIVD